MKWNINVLLMISKTICKYSLSIFLSLWCFFLFRQVYINQRLRESRFDLRSNHCLQTNPILKIKQTTSTLGSHRRNKTDIISMYELLKREEIERLAADVQAILVCNTLTSLTSVWTISSSIISHLLTQTLVVNNTCILFYSGRISIKKLLCTIHSITTATPTKSENTFTFTGRINSVNKRRRINMFVCYFHLYFLFWARFKGNGFYFETIYIDFSDYRGLTIFISIDFTYIVEVILSLNKRMSGNKI